jgi:hypothetical protein
MDALLNVVNQLAQDIRTIGLALLVLVLFYELIAFLVAALHLPRIGIIGVLMVGVGFVVLPSVLAYLTSLG